jgi:hypothetical protein
MYYLLSGVYNMSLFAGGRIEPGFIAVVRSCIEVGLSLLETLTRNDVKGALRSPTLTLPRSTDDLGIDTRGGFIS